MSDQNLHSIDAHTNHSYDEEINLLQLWNVIWKGKWIIIPITALFMLGSLYYALWLPNYYRSEVLLSPVEESNGVNNSNLLGQLGGLASLAGIDLSGGAGTTQKVRAIAILQSRTFIKEFFEEHELTVPFMASRPAEQSGRVEIDPEIYDAENQRWIREVNPPKQPEPTDWEVYQAFSEALTVQDDTTTGLVTVSLEWYDPVQIKEWLDWLIVDLNERMRRIDVAEASRAIDYLNDQLGRTQLVDMRNVFYSLIEQQTRTIMLADAREGYVFQVLDPAVVPEQKSAPSRALICIIGTLLGLMISILLVVIIHAVRLRKR